MAHLVFRCPAMRQESRRHQPNARPPRIADVKSGARLFNVILTVKYKSLCHENCIWALCRVLCILAACNLLTSRSLKYTMLIFTTLIVNILAAIDIYTLVGLSIHIYTLAGITVSLGIIIGTSIVMADHYSYYHDRKVFPALLGATATTIGALCVTNLLPDEVKINLADFSKVIIINLSLSLLMAWLFIPSLLEKFPIERTAGTSALRKHRRTICFNRKYVSFIDWGR